MPKPRQCPDCDNLIKNHKAKHCWGCYNTKYRKLSQVIPPTGSGENHPNWKGGKWLYWRRAVLSRENYTCKNCGLRDELIMDVDHINPKGDYKKNWKNEVHNAENLQVLCPNCHRRKTIKEAQVNSGHLKSR